MRFWRVCRDVLRIQDDVEWKSKRALLVTELTAFRMKTGAFAVENYDTQDACSFWSVDGCHAPNLQEFAMKLTPLPCSSGEPERNWHEVKENLTKKRNRLDRKTLEKIVFVRRFIRLKQKLCANESNACLVTGSLNCYVGPSRMVRVPATPAHQVEMTMMCSKTG